MLATRPDTKQQKNAVEHLLDRIGFGSYLHKWHDEARWGKYYTRDQGWFNEAIEVADSVRNFNVQNTYGRMPLQSLVSWMVYNDSWDEPSSLLLLQKMLDNGADPLMKAAGKEKWQGKNVFEIIMSQGLKIAFQGKTRGSSAAAEVKVLLLLLEAVNKNSKMKISDPLWENINRYVKDKQAAKQNPSDELRAIQQQHARQRLVRGIRFGSNKWEHEDGYTDSYRWFGEAIDLTETVDDLNVPDQDGNFALHELVKHMSSFGEWNEPSSTGLLTKLLERGSSPLMVSGGKNVFDVIRSHESNMSWEERLSYFEGGIFSIQSQITSIESKIGVLALLSKAVPENNDGVHSAKLSKHIDSQRRLVAKLEKLQQQPIAEKYNAAAVRFSAALSRLRSDYMPKPTIGTNSLPVSEVEVSAQQSVVAAMGSVIGSNVVSLLLGTVARIEMAMSWLKVVVKTISTLMSGEINNPNKAHDNAGPDQQGRGTYVSFDKNSPALFGNKAQKEGERAKTSHRQPLLDATVVELGRSPNPTA